MSPLGLFAAGVRLAEWLPAPPLYALAQAAGWVLSALPTGSQRHVRHNLARVLGVAPDSPTLRPYVRGIFRLQAANYVDLFRARRITPQEVTTRVVQGIDRDDGWAAFQRALGEGRGLVLVTAHFGRFEMMSHYLAQRGVRLTLPVERLQPPALFDLVCRLRCRPSFTVVPADLGLRPCLRALQRGEVVALFADRDATGQGVPVSFFGAVARLPHGPALLALRTGAPLFVGFTLPDGPGGRIRPVFEPLPPIERAGEASADVQRTTQLIATALERYIRRYPHQWVMFHHIWPEQTPAMPVCGAQAPSGVS